MGAEKVVQKYLALSGAEVIPQGERYHVLVPIECAKELEGLPYPENNEYYFAFAATDDPEVEVIQIGSSRLERIVGAIRKNSFFAKAFFPGETLSPGLLAHYRLSYLTDQRKEELLLLYLNLMDGEIERLQIEDLATWGTPTPKAGPAKLLEAQLELDRAVEILAEYVKSMALARDDDWALNARIRWREAIEDLESHFNQAKRERGGELLEQERERRLLELEMRFSPRILAIPLNFALVYRAKGTNSRFRPLKTASSR